MPITLTVPTNPQSPGNSGHTTDHNTIVTALSTLGSDALNAAGDTSTGAQTMNKGVLLPANGSPTTPGSTTGLITANANGTPEIVQYSGLTGTIIQTMTDSTSRAVTTAGTYNAVTPAFSISAGDGNVSTVYRVKAYGLGKQGSTAGATGFAAYLNGTVVTNFPGGMAAAGMPASESYIFQVELTITVTTTGSSGKVNFFMNGSAAINSAGANGGLTSNACSFAAAETAFTFNTTVANTIAIYATYAGSGGTPSLTVYNSTFERLGP